MNKEKYFKKLMKDLWKVINSTPVITNGDIIAALEMIKIDIILNDKLVILDGKSGKDATN